VTDWAIHSCGSSKLTVLPGSEKVFQTAAVAPGSGDPGAVVGPPVVGLPVAAPEAAFEAPEPGVPVESAELDVSGCGVQEGPALPWLLHPAASPATISKPVSRSPNEVALPAVGFPVMEPA